jgi:hypothetical protein
MLRRLETYGFRPDTPPEQVDDLARAVYESLTVGRESAAPSSAAGPLEPAAESAPGTVYLAEVTDDLDPAGAGDERHQLVDEQQVDVAVIRNGDR